jgi:hypothetical protein
MSWLYSRALVEAFSEGTSLAGELCAPSSGSLIPQAYCAPDKTTAFSRLSRFGMTFKPLTADRGEELLMSYLAAFPARTFQSRGGGQASTESEAECGDTWRGWLAKYDPATSSWRTAQCSLLEDSPECLVTLPRSGMTRGGLLWERQTLERRTSETGSGLWPTPTAHNAKEGGFPSEHSRNTPTLAAQVGGSLNPMWVEWLMGWPLGWTDLKPLATAKCPNVQPQHGDCLEGR